MFRLRISIVNADFNFLSFLFALIEVNITHL